MSTHKYHLEPRMYDTIWVHDDKPLWIVEYKNEHTTKVPCFRAYQVKQYALPLKKGKKLWAHDNELSHKEDVTYPTLLAAMEAHA